MLNKPERKLRLYTSGFAVSMPKAKLSLLENNKIKQGNEQRKEISLTENEI